MGYATDRQLRISGIVLFCLLCLASPAFAELYKWTDEHGQVHYSNQKPKQLEVEELQLDDNLTPFNSGEFSSDTDFSPAKTKPRAKRKKVVMYGASWCGYCRKARTYFKSNNIPFREKDIENSKTAKQEFDRLGGGGIPLIFVGKKSMRGFTPARFEALYN